MQIYLDTANIDEIRRAARMGILSGVTTNPSLMAKEGFLDFRKALQEIASLVDGPVSAEVIALEAATMVEEGRELASLAPNIVVKIPLTADGLEAVSILSKDNIKVNQTLCFSVNQALLSARAGAAYVSPFVGRLDDIGHRGMEVVAEAVSIFRAYNISTRVLAASLRHPLHCLEAAKAGAHIATMPYKVLMQMLDHPLTEKGIARFTEDWQKVYGGL